jgi:hypothetical protein
LRRSARSTRFGTLPDTGLHLSPRQRAAVLVAGTLLVLQVAGIFAQLVVLSDSNDRIHAQDAKIGELRSDVGPVLDLARPLAEEARPLVRSARGLTGPLARTADDLSLAADEVPPLARGGRRLVGEALPLVAAAREALPELTALMSELRALVPGATRFLHEAERRALLARADAAISATLRLESLQTRQLSTARTQLRIQQRTLAIQREALTHIRNIDRRTGGDLPAG